MAWSSLDASTGMKSTRTSPTLGKEEGDDGVSDPEMLPMNPHRSPWREGLQVEAKRASERAMNAEWRK